jgi:tripartite-type tricarboxylate transporter receptor subunit TctC
MSDASFARRACHAAAQSLVFSLSVLALLAPTAARADYPEKAIRLLIPYGPGGATDVAGRIVAEGMSRQLKQPVIVENKGGGGGVIALREVAGAKPDGYTILVGNVTTNAINAILQVAGTPANLRSELTVVTKLVEVPGMLIATKKNFPPNTMKELVEYAKANPNKVFYNSAGILTYSHLDMLEFQRRAGIDLTIVPYAQGGGAGQTDIVSGEIQLALRNVASAQPFVKSGQIKALAVTTEERLPTFPDVPTFKEQGYAGVGTNAWQAIFVPKGTPDGVMDRINDAAQKVLEDPAVRQRLADLQFVIAPTRTPAEARTWLDQEFAKWQVVAVEGKKKYEAQTK